MKKRRVVKNRTFPVFLYLFTTACFYYERNPHSTFPLNFQANVHVIHFDPWADGFLGIDMGGIKQTRGFVGTWLHWLG